MSADALALVTAAGLTGRPPVEADWADWHALLQHVLYAVTPGDRPDR